jgi:phage tail-like protein
MAMTRPNPGLTSHFKFTVDGLNLGLWTKVEGLGVSYKVHEYKEGGQNGYVWKFPDRAEYTNIKFSRMVDSTTTAVAAWVASVQAAMRRQTAQIAVLDSEYAEVAVWNLIDAWPVKWTGPTLDAGSTDAAIETLEIAHHGFLKPG